MRHLILSITLLTMTLIGFSSSTLAANGASAEPEITITQQGKDIIEEYRINGQLYKIKVTPNKGYPYYLIDTNGDGHLNARRNDLTGDILIPQWTILRWK